MVNKNAIISVDFEKITDKPSENVTKMGLQNSTSIKVWKYLPGEGQISGTVLKAAVIYPKGFRDLCKLNFPMVVWF